MTVSRVLRSLPWIVAGGRVATGVWFLVTPAHAAKVWTGRAGWSEQYFVRSIGGRDLALGAGTLAALAGGATGVPWLLGSVAGDATDATFGAVMLEGRPRRTTLRAAVPYAVLGLAAAAVARRR